MSEYMIMTDSTVDLPKEYLTEELGVPYIPLTYLIDGQSYCNLTEYLTKRTF